MPSIEELISAIEAEGARARVPRLKLHAGQQAVIDNKGRFNVIACGRRWGKTVMGIDLAVESVNKGHIVGWFAPTYKVLEDAYRQVKDTLGPIIERDNKTERVIETAGGGRIEFWSCDGNEDAGRSRKYHRVIIDEAAMIGHLRGLWNAAIRPTLADYQGDAWWLSTPKGQGGFFAEKWRLGQGKQAQGDEVDDIPGWRSWQMPTSSNPHIAAIEIEEARRDTLPSIFRQEWLAEFVMPAGAVFDCFDSRLETDDTGPTNVVAPKAIPPHMDIVLGWDFGSANTACVPLVKSPKTGHIYVTAEYHAAGSDARQHVERMRAKIPRQETVAAGGSNSEDEMRKLFAEAGMAVVKPPGSGAGAVAARITLIYRLLRERKLKVFSTCPMLIAQLESMSYKLDGDGRMTELIEDKSVWHLVDALGYGLMMLEGVPSPANVGGRFGERSNPRV